MKRDSLVFAVQQTAEELGYAFYMGIDSTLPGRVAVFPALWLSPPTMKSSSGRAERRDTYGVCLQFLMALPTQQTDSKVVWDMLESDAFLFYRELGKCAAVRGVRGFRSTPNRKPLTKNGEVSIAVEFDIDLFYYNNL